MNDLLEQIKGAFGKMEKRYRIYSEYLKEKYGTKVYKIPINLPVTCPNRDGTVGVGGCIYCGEEGAGFENLSNQLSVQEQIEINTQYIREKYKAEKFIAYFQNYTNTFLPLKDFKEYVYQACQDDVVQIAISTRPDCINNSYLEVLNDLKKEKGIDIAIELGLQTVNYHTLKKINRGHTLAELVDAVLQIKQYGFESCIHLILNLPWDDQDDVIENAKLLSALRVEQVKLHSLYIVEGTLLGKRYQESDLQMIAMEEYIERVITFLEYLDPDVVVQRLIGRAPKEGTLFVNWNTSWWKIRDMIEGKMEESESYQGKQFDYLNGKALRKFD